MTSRSAFQPAITIISRTGSLLQSLSPPPARLAQPISRATFLRDIDPADCLEIGPFDNPQIKGDGVRYFDVLDTESLRKRARRHGRSFSGVPRIDFVSPTGTLGVIDERFRSVFSAHVVEHQPDLVRHFQDVARILEPGGIYHVVCPDKRYCFDHFIPLSSLDEVLHAHRTGRTNNAPATIRNHVANITHNRAWKHWLGWHGRPKIADDPGIATIAAVECARAARGEYVDVHAWMFTPATFRDIVGTLCREDLIPFTLTLVTQTRFGEQEFFARLLRR